MFRARAEQRAVPRGEGARLVSFDVMEEEIWEGVLGHGEQK